MSGRIRPAMRADLAHLPAIEDAGAETFARFGAPLADGSPPTPASLFEQRLASGMIWVSEAAGGQVVGFLAAAPAEGDLHVEEVDVLIDHQRQGHGRRLMVHAIHWARAQSLRGVTLTTFRHIPWNAPFYASLGFRELAEDETPPRLAAILTEEAERGFENRCAMRLTL